MNIPPHWVCMERQIEGRTCRLKGFSHSSMQAAWAMAVQHAEIMQRFLAGKPTEAAVQRMRAALLSLRGADAASYEVCQLEPVWRTLNERNIITRNRYGALVINSTDTCFADVDAAPCSLWDAVKGLFGAGREPEQRLLDVMRGLCAAHAGLSMRLYRTGKGWRVILAGPGVELGSPLVESLFKKLHVDALYGALCRKQACWRARVSPKPWRLKLPRCPVPCTSDEAAAVQADWVQEYERACAGRAVCRLVECLGPRMQGEIIALHDELTGVKLHSGDLV